MTFYDSYFSPTIDLSLGRMRCNLYNLCSVGLPVSRDGKKPGGAGKLENYITNGYRQQARSRNSSNTNALCEDGGNKRIACTRSLESEVLFGHSGRSGCGGVPEFKISVWQNQPSRTKMKPNIIRPKYRVDADWLGNTPVPIKGKPQGSKLQTTIKEAGNPQSF